MAKAVMSEWLASRGGSQSGAVPVAARNGVFASGLLRRRQLGLVGIVTDISSPPPDRGRAVIVALWARAIALAIEMPSRTPAGEFRRCFSRAKGSNRVGMCSAGMFGPVLAISNTALSGSWIVRISIQPPGLLWRTAFSTRLAIMRSSSTRSPRARAGSSAASTLMWR